MHLLKRGRPIDSRDKYPRKEMSKNIVGENSQHNINETSTEVNIPRTYTIPEENKFNKVLDEIPVPKMKMRSQ